jgi:hypothetical protein
MPRRILLQPLLELLERGRADEVQLERIETELHHMTVSVDESGEQGPALAVDRAFRRLPPSHLPIDNGNDLPVVSDSQFVEVLKLSIGANLQPVDVVNQRICEGWRGEERGGGREQGGAFHRSRIALFLHE